MKALFILFITALIVLFVGLSGKRQLLQMLALAGTLIALATVGYDLQTGSADGMNSIFASMIHLDTYALSFTGVALLTVGLIIGLSGWEVRQLSATLGDNYGLLLFSLCGALCMFAYTNVVMLFLGIEILSIPLYVLAGSRRDDLASNEAALKYFLMGAFATGILLFGIALMYGATGSFNLNDIASCIRDGRHSAGMLHTGIILILIGLSFKVSAAPFHFWAPDVYQGSPNLVTAFMATLVKTAGFAAFYRLFDGAFASAAPFWMAPVAVIAGLTMTLANFTAIWQQDFKRMMAYSSISHAGYLLLAILSIGQAGASGAMLVYLLTYSIATVGAFAVFMIVSEENLDSSFSAFNGLSKKQPFLAGIMTLCMLSLAGIPPTAGFFGKYFLFSTALAQYPWLVVLAVVNSAVSIYYYFKVIIAMYFSNTENTYSIRTPLGFRVVMLLGLLLLVMLTIFPGVVYNML